MQTQGEWTKIGSATLTWGSSAASTAKTMDLAFTSVALRKNANRRVRIDIRNASTVSALSCIAKNRVEGLATTGTFSYWATVSFPTAGNMPYTRVLSSGLGVGNYSSTGTIGRLYVSNDTAVSTSQGFVAKVKVWAERRA